MCVRACGCVREFTCVCVCVCVCVWMGDVVGGGGVGGCSFLFFIQSSTNSILQS